MNQELIIVITTTDDEILANEIALHLIKTKLAVCIQVDTTNSFFNWKNEISKVREYRLTIKTFAAKYVEVKKAITGLHNYDIPEIIKLEIDEISEKYLKWCNESLV